MEFLDFAVEYRCAGSRAGQFLVTLHFNVSWPSEKNHTHFILKQEKICAVKDGRRGLTGKDDFKISQKMIRGQNPEQSGKSYSNGFIEIFRIFNNFSEKH